MAVDNSHRAYDYTEEYVVLKYNPFYSILISNIDIVINALSIIYHLSLMTDALYSFA